MLAANGSIFTILAISFERYYAICKPLKAGYKCTRVRATVIICLIWLLASVLTSPILIMAKSSQTIYIDGSLVYNCILETDSYWPKMYVFVSMFAFFCLPLLILILVYWLIGRRLTRENLAMSSTKTSLANKDSQESSTRPFNYARKRVFISKTVSLKSLSTFLSSWRSNDYQHISGHQSNSLAGRPEVGRRGRADLAAGGSNQRLGGRRPAARGALEPCSGPQLEPDIRRTELPARSPARAPVCKAFSLDHQQLMANRQAGGPTNGLRMGAQVGANDMTPANGLLSAIAGRIRQASQFINKLFYSKSSFKCAACDANSASSGFQAFVPTNKRSILDQSSNPANEDSVSLAGVALTKVDANCVSMPFLARSFAQDQAKQLGKSQLTFHPAPQMTSLSAAPGKDKRKTELRFHWSKSSSIASSYASEQTNSTVCTGSHDSSSLTPQHSSTSSGYSQPKPILLCDSSGLLYSRGKSIKRANRRKSARFDLDTGDSRESDCLGTHPSSSSASEPNSGSLSSHSSSPDSLFEQQQQPIWKRKRCCTTNSPVGVSLSVDQALLTAKVRDFGALIEDELGTGAQTGNDLLNSPSLPPAIVEAPKLIGNCDNLNSAGPVEVAVRQSSNESSKCFVDLAPSFTCRSGRDADADADDDAQSGPAGQQVMRGDSNPGRPTIMIRQQARTKGRSDSQPSVLSPRHGQANVQLNDLLVVQGVSKKQQMDSRRQVVVMLAFVVACFFLLFLPYRLFTFWLILSTEDQVQSLGMETYYNLTYFSRILIYLHSAINPIAYNLISTKFRRAFISILFCRGSSSRRHFTTEHQVVRQYQCKDAGEQQQQHHHHHQQKRSKSYVADR